jgi:hypothetical protein
MTTRSIPLWQQLQKPVQKSYYHKHNTTLCSDHLDLNMLLQLYVPALLLTHGALASSNKGNPPPVDYLLRSGREYSAPEVDVLAVSGQTNNDSAMMTSQENHNNNNTAITSDQTEPNAWSRRAALEQHPRRLAELERAGVVFSSYLYWEDPEGCPSLQPECEDCGGLNTLWHRDVLVPSPRCSGVSLFFRFRCNWTHINFQLVDEGMKWKDCRCGDDELRTVHITPVMPLPDPDAESEPDL